MALALAIGSCATARPAVPDTVATAAGPIQLDFVEWNASTQQLLEGAVPEAAKVLTRWGGLVEPVRITVVNSHWELEEAVGRPLARGISAWARRNQVLLWDPRWWPVPPSAEHDPVLAAQIRRIQVTGLLEHELTHCLMFQRAGGPPSDPGNRIPFWFREGMATVTAGEGAQWPPPESLAQWLAARPGIDLLGTPRPWPGRTPRWRTAPPTTGSISWSGGTATARCSGSLDRMRRWAASRRRSRTRWESASRRSRPTSAAGWSGEVSASEAEEARRAPARHAGESLGP